MFLEHLHDLFHNKWDHIGEAQQAKVSLFTFHLVFLTRTYLGFASVCVCMCVCVCLGEQVGEQVGVFGCVCKYNVGLISVGKYQKCELVLFSYRERERIFHTGRKNIKQREKHTDNHTQQCGGIQQRHRKRKKINRNGVRERERESDRQRDRETERERERECERVKERYIDICRDVCSQGVQYRSSDY